jgi:TolB-like protein/Tfp pilus assembly protein PilF
MTEPPTSRPSTTPPDSAPAGAPAAAQPAPGPWQRLKEHKVIQWTLIYAAAAYTLLHGAEMLSDAQEWPHVIVRVLSMALILGIPIVATLAWFHGHRAQHRVSGPEIAILTILLFVAGSILWWLSRTHAEKQAAAVAMALPAAATGAAAPAPDQSIAVLPFVNMSSDPEQEYFSDGLAEELIDQLTKVTDLRVPGRTSSFYFKGKSEDVATIALKLRVAHLLEGSVRKSGHAVRITAQLIQADSGYDMWSQTYDRDLNDIFKVQDEIAGAVVAALKAKLLPAQQLQSGHHTESSEAYDQYLLGKQSFNRSNADGLRIAISDYRKAIALDANFAPAYAGLAESEAALADTDTGEHAALQRAREAADRAIALAPEAPEGYAARGSLRELYFWDWNGARADIEKAIALDPGDATFQVTYSQLLRSLGLMPEAIVAAKKATVADPLSDNTWGNLGYILMNDRQFAAAREAQNRALQINPGSIWPRYRLAQIELVDGHAEQALMFAQTSSRPEVGTAMASYTLGRSADSQRALDELISRYAQTLAYQIAQVYAWRGETDQAFAWLDRSYAQHDAGLANVKTDPFLGKIRADPRFEALLKKMGLPL